MENRSKVLPRNFDNLMPILIHGNGPSAYSAQIGCSWADIVVRIFNSDRTASGLTQINKYIILHLKD